jgi:peptide chain release factor 2
MLSCNLKVNLKKCGGIFDVASKEAELKQLEILMGGSDFWNNQKAARETLEKATRCKSIVEPYRKLCARMEEIKAMIDLVDEASESEQPSLLEEAADEINKAQNDFLEIEFKSLLGGKFDRHNAYLSLHAGAGGTEACDWVAILLRMYRRYCENKGFLVTIMDSLPGEEAGIKSCTLLVSGEYAYGYLSAERGVHRLVRISPFDANKRRHTSFASLDVIAELDEEDDEIEIDDAELEIDTFRSGGAGGQHVNKTDSAVRIKHIATGIIVACQSERSQHANKTKAMRLLKAKVFEYMQDQKRQEMEKFYGEKGEIAWGRQIRSYVLQPYTLVKDHRSGFEIGNVQSVLEGNIDPFIEAYLKYKKIGKKFGQIRQSVEIEDE